MSSEVLAIDNEGRVILATYDRPVERTKFMVIDGETGALIGDEGFVGWKVVVLPVTDSRQGEQSRLRGRYRRQHWEYTGWRDR